MRHIAAFVFCALQFIACSEPNPVFVVAENAAIQAESVHTTIVTDSSGKIKSSDIYLDYPADSILAKFKIGDIVTVAIVGYDTIEMPVVEYTNDVPIAWFMLSAIKGSETTALTIHYGEIADVLKLTGATGPIEVVISLKEKGGYLQGLDVMHHTQYLSPYSENYLDLSVEDFANFREVRTTGIGEHKLYRSSSPINYSLGRDFYADSLAKDAGVATFINLTDSEELAKSYKSYESSYYSLQSAIFLSMPVDFYAESFKKGLIQGFRYMTTHEGPYLVHCTYGMDRTGFTIAVLEALMGATAEEIQADYAKTFSNYYNIVDGKHIALDEQQVDFFKSVVLKNLQIVYHAEGINVPNTSDVDWALATENYLMKLGMTAEEISALKEKLKPRD